MVAVSSVASVTECPSCNAASSHSTFDVILWQLDPLVTFTYSGPIRYFYYSWEVGLYYRDDGNTAKGI